MIGAWLSEVKEQIDALIEGTPLGKNVLVKLMPSGKPAPIAGEFFIAIHYQGLTTNVVETNGSIQQEISIGVTISQRTRWSPEDRDGDRILLRSLDSLAAFSTALAPLLHLNYPLLYRVDSSPLLGLETQAVEPLLLESISGPEERDKSWWMNPESTDLDMQPVGFSMTLSFGGGLTITKLGCVSAQEDLGGGGGGENVSVSVSGSGSGSGSVSGSVSVNVSVSGSVSGSGSGSGELTPASSQPQPPQ